MRTAIRWALLAGAILLAAPPAVAQNSSTNSTNQQAIAPSGSTTVQKGVATPAAPQSCADRKSPLPDGSCAGGGQTTNSQGGSNADTSATPASSMK